MFVIANNAKARELHGKWKSLLAEHEFFQSIPNELRAIPGVDFLFTQLADSQNLADVLAQHDTARDKVCSFVAVRALCRPLKPDEKRGTAISHAKATIKELDGRLPPKPDVLMGSQC